MKKYIIILTILTCVLCVLSIGCTANTRARTFGGTERIELPPDMRLLNITWKGDDNSLWLLLEPRGTNQPRALVFQEKSRFGLVQGQVILTER